MDKIKFAVFTDLHYDVIPDGYRRLQKFIGKVKKRNIDFIIELGDMCHPIEENRIILESMEKTGVPCYHTLGNHDSDIFSREQVMNFLGMKNNYYSFVKGNIKFIVLDACYIKSLDGYAPYYKRNYTKTLDNYPYIPPEELSWLANELNDNSEYYILFSHHSLANEFYKRGVANRQEVRAILENANRREKRVLMCMNGHDHGDAAVNINRICYYTLNSMSYIWHGLKETYNYSNEIHKKYPGLKDMILYEEGLYAIVTISRDGHLKIEGMRGNYQNITLSDVGILNNMWNGVSIEPIVSSMNMIVK
jgi:3',5'-cyclic AMP phosphodiesterase CpdA